MHDRDARDPMGHGSQAGLAETCERRDDSPSSNLGGEKQGGSNPSRWHGPTCSQQRPARKSDTSKGPTYSRLDFNTSSRSASHARHATDLWREGTNNKPKRLTLSQERESNTRRRGAAMERDGSKGVAGTTSLSSSLDSHTRLQFTYSRKLVTLSSRASVRMERTWDFRGAVRSQTIFANFWRVKCCQEIDQAGVIDDHAERSSGRHQCQF